MPIAKIPRAGEYVALKTNKEIQGVSVEVVGIVGPGEFTYANHELAGSAPKISANREKRMTGRITQVFARNGANTSNSEVEMSRLRDYQVVSKVPHLVLRESRETEVQVNVMEVERQLKERFGIEKDEFHDRKAMYLRFIPLEFKPGDTNKTLTVVVQKLRIAEFVVNVPGTR